MEETTHSKRAAESTSDSDETALTIPSRSPSGHTKLIGKLRLDRGPLRWWLIVTSILLVQCNLTRYCIGSLLLVVGAVLRFVSKGYLRQARGFIQREGTLTTAGPYRFIRNPFYLGNLIAELGLVLVVGRFWLATVYFLVWAWVYYHTIKREEAKLAQLAHEEFSWYRRRVPRLFPRPWKFLSASEVRGPHFSWSNPNIAHGTELERTVRLSSYPLLLFIAGAIRMNWRGVLEHPSSDLVLAILGLIALNLLARLSTACLKRGNERASSLVESNLDRWSSSHAAAA